MENKQAKAAIEAALFAAGYPVSFEKLAEALELSMIEISNLVADLQRDCAEEGRGIQLLNFGDSCQLCTKEEYIDKVRTALGIRQGGNLSKTSLETLAIVAYHQPVTKSYIEQLRGIDSTYSVNNLVEKQLIEVCGRLDAPGRPALYRTTDTFLRVFGITGLSELPPVEILGAPEIETGDAKSTGESIEEAVTGISGEISENNDRTTAESEAVNVGSVSDMTDGGDLDASDNAE